MNNNDHIADVLNEVQSYIDSDRSDEAVGLLSKAVEAEPSLADKRLAAELGLIERLITSRKMLKDSEYARSFEMVSKYCRHVYGNIDELNYSGVDQGFLPDIDKIWICWLQGLENAPDIVKVCIDSVRRIGREVIILDEENIHNYVDMPSHIVDAYRQGNMSSAHYSDLLRLELLTGRGGMWVDSTVYCTSADMLLDISGSCDLFAYRAICADNISKYATYDSWLMYASRPSLILEDTKRMLHAYWHNESDLKHYFLLHLMMNIACERHRDEEAGIPIFSSEPCHVLQMEMHNPYSEHRYEQIKSMSGIHKLTYKYDVNADIHGTYLEKILKS
ncbi:MAG: capsular polysaccharide synthesis protein [Lachnospiraceae bacterium]|nr:capsular polysaccharide synthesis protein [Lachnospiraceae bacterium]